MYDYSSESRRLELPNPYRVENAFLLLCAAVLVTGAVVSLLRARAGFEAAIPGAALVPLVVGLGLLFGGLGFAVMGARRLRFFFGRGRPLSLAPELPVGATGNSARADFYKNMLRQGGLEYNEPHGALNGILYHALPRLITAPVVVQGLAQVQFFNALSFAATLASFVFAWGVFGNEATRPLVSVVYFLFGAVVLLRPLVAGTRAALERGALVALMAFAVVGPAITGWMAHVLPPARVALQGQALFLLVAALVAVVLILAALAAQVDPLPQTQRSCEQRTLSMNGPPGVLVTELDRKLQAAWVEGIPNRRYARREPDTPAAAGAGRFAGELMEETQPMPLAGTAPVTLERALLSPRHHWLVAIDVYATLLVLLGVMCALIDVRRFDPAHLFEAGWGAHGLAAYAAVALAVGAFCFQSAGRIWGRFDFESALTWVEVQGNWQSSRIGTGSALSSRLHSDNEIVRVEAMTLRVWRARIESVVFGKDGSRQVVAMFATSLEAERLASELEAFAAGQSVFVAPGASEDPRRLQALRAAEALLGGEQPVRDALAADTGSPARLHPGDPPPRVESGGAPPPARPRFCAACGEKAEPNARFCSACGLPLA
ncbi:MAG TPA: zinc ribbon domain-containing protein [Burkholderiaceae bacterium]|jgi:hypothetical protein|nr:zinc ribbon domain-containing protein [Burkholderiaceae bacterium]